MRPSCRRQSPACRTASSRRAPTPPSALPSRARSHSLSSPPGTIVIRLRSKERPMRRGTTPSKAKVESKRPVPKSQTSENASVLHLEERLAEALKREAEAQEQLQTRNRELVE